MQVQDSVTNIVKNVATMYNPADSKFLGSVQFILTEVVVSKLIRQFMKADRSLTDLAFVHAISLPYLGGLDFYSTDENPIGGDWSTQFYASASQIPALMLAEYIYSVFCGQNLAHMPHVNVKDAMITVASKTLSRPIYSALASQNFFPDNLRDSYEVLTAVIENQRQRSNITAWKK